MLTSAGTPLPLESLVLTRNVVVSPGAKRGLLMPIESVNFAAGSSISTRLALEYERPPFISAAAMKTFGV